MSTYYVTRIEEPDFGCEGRPEGQEIKDKVYLKEEITKEETIIFMEDKLLYERDINEGNKVVIDGDGHPEYFFPNSNVCIIPSSMSSA